MTTATDVLKAAGRYDSVIKILNNIERDVNPSVAYPVDPYIDDSGNTSWRISGSDIRYEANIMLTKLIASEDTSEDKFLNLNLYCSSMANMYLHNYAISISHRNKPTIDMEDIRTWLCVGAIIDAPHCTLYGTTFSWDEPNIIPVGWKALMMRYKK